MSEIADYKSIWLKWVTLLSSETKNKKEILDSLHIEVTKGLDILTKISSEEIKNQAELGAQLLKDNLVIHLARLTFAGYLLFLIENSVDPKEANLIEKTRTNELGTLWMSEYEKDQNKSLFEKIDPIISIILEKEAKIQSTSMFQESKTTVGISYKDSFIIESFLIWAIHQGYILGMLEHQLNQQ